MAFSTLVFPFVFLPVSLILYFVLPKRLKNAALVVCSLVFFAWGTPEYLVLMVLDIAFHYFAGRELALQKARGRSRRFVLVSSVLVNLLLLGFFKYYGFLVDNLNALLGTELSEDLMREILVSLGFILNGDDIYVPSWRGDVEHYSDIAEEVARFYGYNKIPCTLMRGQTTSGGYTDAQKAERSIGVMARALGYSEIITYSFISPSYYDKIRLPADSPLRNSMKILNPLGEDTSIMRTIILPSMLDILSRNYAMKNKGVKLYEIGKIYLPKDGEKLPDEPKRMIFGTYGEHENFFTLKGEIDAILDQLNVHPATYIADTKNPSYHPGRCADIVIDGKKMGVIGQIHPLVAETYGIGGEVYVAELDFTGLQAVLAPERVFHSLPKFPTVSRDLALVCEESMTVGMLEACIKKAGGKLLRSVQLFDIYRGPGIAPGKKSIAFSLELRADDRTLTDEDTTGVMNAVLEKLKNDLGVSLR